MASYTRRSGDLQYRKVNIKSNQLSDYKAFTGPGETISYTDYQVMEVLREDGTTELFHEGGAEITHYAYDGVDKIRIKANIPLERVWMRHGDGTGIVYKVPSGLTGDGTSVEFRVPCGVQDMELFGDRYFEMIYKLRKT